MESSTNSAERPIVPYSVLIVEDEPSIAENLFLALDAQGYVVDMVRDAASALHRVEQEAYDVILLDVGLPGMDGLRLLRALREDMQLAVPVLLLTARATLEDKLAGFGHGADDYLVKPFAMEEVFVRVKALIRRTRQLSDTALVLRYGPLSYAVAHQRVCVNGQAVRLPRKSVLILELLMRYAGRVAPRQKLEELLWQGEPPSADALRSQVHLLRKQLVGHGYDGIETVHGVGWKLARLPEQSQGQ